MTDGEKIRSWLQEEVITHWEANSSALLLSRVGFKLRKEFPDFAEQMPNGLKAFLLRWPIAHIVQHPAFVQKIGLVPSSVPLPDNHADVFGESKSRPRHTAYIETFWRAFIEPIKGRRYIYIDQKGEEPIEVQDIAPPALPRESSKEVLSTDLGPIDSDLPPEEKGKITHEKIREWLVRNKISSDSVRRIEKGPVQRDYNLAEKIGRAFLEMSSDDLSRISVPLDIVIDLLKKNQ